MSNIETRLAKLEKATGHVEHHPRMIVLVGFGDPEELDGYSFGNDVVFWRNEGESNESLEQRVIAALPSAGIKLCSQLFR